VRGREGVPLKAAKIIVPIGIYLQYKILDMVHATDVMWLLFWINVPVMILFQIISKVAESVRD
jgi:hypothetical protein